MTPHLSPLSETKSRILQMGTQDYRGKDVESEIEYVTYSNVGETDHSGLPKTEGDDFQEVGLSVLKLDQS